jgi:hypothetical protein
MKDVAQKAADTGKDKAAGGAAEAGKAAKKAAAQDTLRGSAAPARAEEPPCSCSPSAMPRIRSGRWRPGSCSRNCARR